MQTTETFSALETWILDGKPALSAPELTGVPPLAQALVTAAAHQRDESPLLYIAQSPGSARDLIDNLAFFAGSDAADRTHYLPAPEFDYYRGLLPNPETLCERNVGLFHALHDPRGRVFVTTLSALLQKLVPTAEFRRASRRLRPAEEIDRDRLVHDLIEAGYQRQPTSFDPGIFSVRGGVIDVFCPLYPMPLRLEFFGDTVEEIRLFDPQSQRSLDRLEEAYLIPVGLSLVPHGDEYAAASLKVKDRLDHLGVPRAERDELLERVRSGILPIDSSFLFPLLSGGSEGLAAYFPADTRYFWEGRRAAVELALERELPKLVKSFELFEKQPMPIASRESLFLSADEIEALSRRGTAFEAFESPNSGPEGRLHAFEVPAEQEGHLKGPPRTAQTPVETKGRTGVHPRLDAMARRLREWMDLGHRVHLVCHTRTHAERVQMLFQGHGLPAGIQPEGDPAFPRLLTGDPQRVQLWQGSVSQSLCLPQLRLVILGEESLFGQKKRTARHSAWTSSTDATRVLSSFRDLNTGDFVVHRDQGIGRYFGLKAMNFLGVENDYVLLEYKDGDKLYIPIYRLGVLQKYVGGEGAAPVLDKLGGDRWLKAKGKAQRAVAELAAELLKIQARRKLAPGYGFPEPSADYQQFEMEFPFDETPDQLKAIEDVNRDLSQPHPMDRLICGDVGYGKTEVAMRAVYRALLAGRQAAVLVPTTVLAFQHFETFRQRFQNTGARIEMVSRLRTGVDAKRTLAELKEGKVDVLIGTHRLLSADVAFPRLGLIVVDEEHRFGVVHKEKLKKMAEDVHYLAMSATPIPRTLNMAMTGIKEISIITTPPPDRLAVRTFVCRNQPELLAEAIGNELARGGQVFFVHNRIESIFRVAEDLQQLMPKIKIEVTHGQMDGDLLEKKMLAFYRGEAQVLLTTTIIESGLDIPRANTILIDDAQNMGLAQLYQLRGRVGRSDKRAYCYLLVPSESALAGDAKQRLQVIQRYTDLGSGFSVASHDLEIRGAGDLLGKEQSGHLNAIGIDLYFELLEDSIRELRGEEKKNEIEPEISLKIAASFPNAYLPDIGERIALYRRLSNIEHEEEIADIETEIRDRFGNLPEEVINLLGLMRMKLYLKRLHVVRMSCGPKRTALQFAESTPVSAGELVKLVQSDPKRYAITPDQKLVFSVQETDWRAQLREVQRLAERLGVD